MPSMANQIQPIFWDPFLLNTSSDSENSWKKVNKLSRAIKVLDKE
jgi:hypothetical protein